MLIMETLLALDTRLFHFINSTYHGPVFDGVALVLSGVGSAGIIWFVSGVILFLKEEKKDHRFFVPIVLAGAMSFVLIELLVKFVVSRPRPTEEMGAIIIDRSASWYSFPSSHAAISWAMAVVLTSYEPKLKWVWMTLALLISVSRIYLGVHYPLDVLAGSVFGVGIGTFVLRMTRTLLGVHRGKSIR